MFSEIVPALPNPLLGLVFSLSDEGALSELRRDAQFKDIVQRVDILRLTKVVLAVFSHFWYPENHIPDESLFDDIWCANGILACKGYKVKENIEYFLISQLFRIKLLPLNSIDQVNTIFNFVSLLPPKQKEVRDALINRLVREILLPGTSYFSSELVSTKRELDRAITIANRIDNNLTRKDFYTIFVGKYLDPMFSKDLLNICHSYKKDEIFRSLSLTSLERAQQLVKKGENPEEYLAFFAYFIKQIPDEMAEIIKNFFKKNVTSPNYHPFPTTLKQIEFDLKLDEFYIMLIKKLTSRQDQFLCIKLVIRRYFWKNRNRTYDMSKLIKAVLDLETNEFSNPVHPLSRENFIEIECYIRKGSELLTKLFTITMHVKTENYDAIFTLLVDNIKNEEDYYDLFNHFIKELRSHTNRTKFDLPFIQRIINSTQLDLASKNYKSFMGTFLSWTFAELFGPIFTGRRKIIRPELIEDIQKIQGNKHFKELMITALKSRKS